MIGKKTPPPKKATTAEVDTLIGQNTTVKGDLSFEGGLHVEGSVIGNVRAHSEGKPMLILNESGSIEGDVEVPNMLINGTVIGDVYAAGHAELAPNARIKGNVYYQTIEMAVGAQINGNLVHRDPSEAKPSSNKPVGLVSTGNKKADASGGKS